MESELAALKYRTLGYIVAVRAKLLEFYHYNSYSIAQHSNRPFSQWGCRGKNTTLYVVVCVVPFVRASLSDNKYKSERANRM